MVRFESLGYKMREEWAYRLKQSSDCWVAPEVFSVVLLNDRAKVPAPTDIFLGRSPKSANHVFRYTY